MLTGEIRKPRRPPPAPPRSAPDLIADPQRPAASRRARGGGKQRFPPAAMAEPSPAPHAPPHVTMSARVAVTRLGRAGSSCDRGAVSIAVTNNVAPTDPPISALRPACAQRSCACRAPAVASTNAIVCPRMRKMIERPDPRGQPQPFRTCNVHGHQFRKTKGPRSASPLRGPFVVISSLDRYGCGVGTASPASCGPFPSTDFSTSRHANFFPLPRT